MLRGDVTCYFIIPSRFTVNPSFPSKGARFICGLYLLDIFCERTSRCTQWFTRPRGVCTDAPSQFRHWGT